MTTKNPSNPYTSDANHTSKDVQMPLSKARVVNVNDSASNGFHTVRIRVYGDGTSYVAPVLTPSIGSVVIPQIGDDVAVLFDSADDPWVIGTWYAADRVDNEDIDLPEYDVGDLRFGNHSGSNITITNSGDINIEVGDENTINSIGDTIDESKSVEEIEDIVASALVGNDKLTVTYDDANDEIKLNTSALDNEEVQDVVGDLLVGGTDVTVTYDDAADTITIDVNTFSGSHTDLTDVTSDDHHAKYTDTEARSAVEDSTLNSLTLSRTGLNASESWLEINGGSNGILLGYDQNANDIRSYQDVNLYGGSDFNSRDGNMNLSGGSMTTTNFEVTENSSTNSLDFNYTG